MSARFRPGDRVLGGAWQLETLVAAGTWEAWKGRHPHLRRIAPVLLLFGPTAPPAEHLDRVAVAGPGVAALLTAYLDADPVCLIYEWIDGGPLPTDLIARVAEILAPLHRQRPPLVHGALSVERIRTRPDGSISLAEFGPHSTGDPRDDVRALCAISTRLGGPPLPDVADAAALLREQGEVVVVGRGRSIGAAVRGGARRVRVPAGVYRESVVLDGPVSLIADPGAVLECSDGTALTVRGGDAAVSGLTVVRHAGRGHALDVAGGRPTFDGCTFRGGVGCVSVRGDAVPTFRGCAVRDGRDAGVSVTERAGAVFVGGSVTGHAGDGLALRTDGDVSLDGCDVGGNGRLGLTAAGTGPTVRGGRFERNAHGGVWLHGGGGGRFERVTFADNGRSAVNLSTAADPAFVGCRIDGGVAGGVFAFDGGRGRFDGCEIVGHALAGVEARDGGEVTLRDCVIRDGRAAGVSVHGGGAVTLERCEVTGHAGPGAVARGGRLRVVGGGLRGGRASGAFVLDGGEATLDGVTIEGHALAGVEVRGRGRAALVGCVLRGGRASGAFANGGQVALQRCEVTGHAAAGLVACDGGVLTAGDTTVSGGAANGVLLYQRGVGTFARCRVVANAKAGLEVREGALADLSECRVGENGYEGVWVHGAAEARVARCDLSGNRRGAWDVAADSHAQRDGNEE